MCNDYRLKVDVASIVEDFADLKIKIRFSEGAPNIEARDDIKITDMDRSFARSTACAAKATCCSGDGAGRGKTSGRFTISDRRDASSPRTAA